MKNEKINITQKEFDDMYQIEEITEESTTVPLSAKPLDDTTPEFLTDEEQAFDTQLNKDYPTPEEKDD